MKTQWTNAKVWEVIQEAREAGRVAGQRKLAELQHDGPQWAVQNETGKTVGTMLDLCGSGWLRIKARGKFYLIAKTLSQEAHFRFYCRHDSYYGGASLSIYDSTMRQEMSVNKAALQAQAAVLAKYGLEASIHTYID